MKCISFSLLIFFCAPQLMQGMSQEALKDTSEDSAECTEEIMQEGCKLIDALFDKAHASVVAKEEIMTSEWIGKQEEIRQLQNLQSDAAIIFTFDKNTESLISRKLATYVEHKINKEIPLIFAIDGITINRVKDFYEFSHAMCALSGGVQCGRVMRAIKSDNFDRMLKLKLQKMARKQLKKEDSEQLRQALLCGGHRYKGG